MECTYSVHINHSVQLLLSQCSQNVCLLNNFLEEHYCIKFYDDLTDGLVDDTGSQTEGQTNGWTWSPHKALFFNSNKHPITNKSLNSSTFHCYRY
jgi:hypothetical protein